MNEIDDVLAESLRRRAAEVRLGGGSMADVQQRVVRRRRRVAGAMCAAIVLPALVAVGFVVGQRSRSGDGVNAASGQAVAIPTTAADAVYCTTSGVDSTILVSPDQLSVTSTSVPFESGNWCGNFPGPCQSVSPDGSANGCVICTSTDVAVPVPDPGWTSYPLDEGSAPNIVPGTLVATTSVGTPSQCGGWADGWQCYGDPTAQGDGWTSYSYCEQTFATTNKASVGPSASTTVPEPITSTTVSEPITSTTINGCTLPRLCTEPTSTTSP